MTDTTKDIMAAMDARSAVYTVAGETLARIQDAEAAMLQGYRNRQQDRHDKITAIHMEELEDRRKIEEALKANSEKLEKAKDALKSDAFKGVIEEIVRAK